MKLLGSQHFKTETCIANIHENCALGFTCECGCHLKTAPPKIVLKTKQDLEDWNRARFETENQ